MYPMSYLLRYCLAIWLLWLIGLGQAQEKHNEERLRVLEQKFQALEDYLKEQVAQLAREVQSKSQSLTELTAKNKALEQEVGRLREHLSQAESEILKTKIEIALIKKGTVAAVPAKSNESVAEAVTEDSLKPSPVPLPVASYTDPQVQKCAQNLQAIEASIRIGAVLELSRLPVDDATRVLVGCLEDKDAFVKMLACKSLGVRKARPAIASLFKLLMDKEPDVRQTAALALEKISGVTVNFSANSSDKEREKKMAQWQELLKKQGIWEEPK